MARLTECTNEERPKTHVIGFTSLGMVEMTRKKVRESIKDTLQQPCPYCAGTGRVLSEETLAHQVERRIVAAARDEDIAGVYVELHPQIAAKVIGPGGANVRRLEEKTGKVSVVKGRDDFHFEQGEIPATQDEGQLVHRATRSIRDKCWIWRYRICIPVGPPMEFLDSMDSLSILKEQRITSGKNSRSRLLRFFAPMLKAK